MAPRDLYVLRMTRTCWRTAPWIVATLLLLANWGWLGHRAPSAALREGRRHAAAAAWFARAREAHAARALREGRAAPAARSASGAPAGAPCALRFSDERPATYLGGCVGGDPCRSLVTLEDALRECGARAACGGITRVGTSYQLRVSTEPTRSPSGERESSWVKLACPIPLLPPPNANARRKSAADDARRAPPRGWSSWNAFGGAVTQADLDAMMSALVDKSRRVNGVRTSLAELGYVTVGLDDGWQFHDADGMPIVDGLKFPSLKASVDRAHALGLRAGFYVNNCLCAEVDMLSHDAPRIDAAITATSEAIVAIGYDAVKIDSCGDLKNISQWRKALGPSVLLENCFQGGLSPSSLTTPVVMSSPVRGRPNVLIERSNAPCAPDAAECDYQTYRTSADIEATWTSIVHNLETAARYLDGVGGAPRDGPRSHPGLWAYPDMLEVGRPGLSAAEERSHFAAWAIVSSPLTLSFDLTDDDALQRAWPVITNGHLLRANSAWAGSAGVRLRKTDAMQVWAKPLGGGEHALLVIAVGEASARADLPLREIVGDGEIGAEMAVCDGYADGGACAEVRRVSAAEVRAGATLDTGEVAPHDSRFYLLRTAS